MLVKLQRDDVRTQLTCAISWDVVHTTSYGTRPKWSKPLDVVCTIWVYTFQGYTLSECIPLTGTRFLNVHTFSRYKLSDIPLTGTRFLNVYTS